MAIPTKPGFYWAKWIRAEPDTHEGEELTLPTGWEVVEVWENFIGEPCEADADEKWRVFVGGVRESQRLECFVWGAGPLEMPEQICHCGLGIEDHRYPVAAEHTFTPRE